MEIEVFRSKQRLTKNLVRQMSRGHNALCSPHEVLGYVVNLIPGELQSAIIKQGTEYYTLPLDYYLSPSSTSCIRQVKRTLVEYRFKALSSSVCREVWWATYELMREKALQTHIYVL